MFTLGRIPADGDQIVVEGVKLEVEAMAGRRVERVRVCAAGPDDEEES